MASVVELAVPSSSLRCSCLGSTRWHGSSSQIRFHASPGAMEADAAAEAFTG